ncbi:MAG: Trk system potassium transporter TrkA [Nitrospirae bacterium]|nr:Trk system potassium transporter TrkA [Nitrospirota bacterium]
MNIIVAGLGEVGFHLVRRLYKQGHNISAVDADEEKTRRVTAEMDVKIVRGHAASAKTLQQAGCAQADLLLAVTDHDEVNLVTCFHGKHLGAKKSVARVKRMDRLLSRRNTYREEMGIDLLVSPSGLTVTEILKIIRDPAAVAVENFAEGKITVRRFKLPEDSAWASRRLQDIQEFRDTIVALVTRSGKSFVPTGTDTLKAADYACIVSTPARMQELEKEVGFKNGGPNRVMIVGGGTIGVGLAMGLEALDARVKLIDNQKSQCEKVLERVKRTEVIHGDGLDLSLLKEENVGSMNVFVASTSKDETNLMASLLAKQYGVPRVVAILQSVDNAVMGEKLGIDCAFTPAVLAADRLYQYIMRAQVHGVTSIAEGEAEVLEMQVPPRSPATHHPLSKVNFPKGSLVGAVIRHGDVILPGGSTQLAEGDTVILFALTDVAEKAEKLIHG